MLGTYHFWTAFYGAIVQTALSVGTALQKEMLGFPSSSWILWEPRPAIPTRSIFVPCENSTLKHPKDSTACRQHGLYCLKWPPYLWRYPKPVPRVRPWAARASWTCFEQGLGHETSRGPSNLGYSTVLQYHLKSAWAQRELFGKVILQPFAHISVCPSV